MLGDTLGHEIRQARCAHLARRSTRGKAPPGNGENREAGKERVIDGRVRAEGKRVDE
jgi:hypothetical protein